MENKSERVHVQVTWVDERATLNTFLENEQRENALSFSSSSANGSGPSETHVVFGPLEGEMKVPLEGEAKYKIIEPDKREEKEDNGCRTRILYQNSHGSKEGILLDVPYGKSAWFAAGDFIVNIDWAVVESDEATPTP